MVAGVFLWLYMGLVMAFLYEIWTDPNAPVRVLHWALAFLGPVGAFGLIFLTVRECRKLPSGKGL